MLRFITLIFFASCIQTDAPTTVDDTALPTAKPSKNTRNKIFKSKPEQYITNGYLNLIAKKEVDFSPYLDEFDSFDKITIKSNGETISMGFDEFENNHGTFLLPIKRDGEKYIVEVLLNNGTTEILRI